MEKWIWEQRCDLHSQCIHLIVVCWTYTWDFHCRCCCPLARVAKYPMFYTEPNIILTPTLFAFYMDTSVGSVTFCGTWLNCYGLLLRSKPITWFVVFVRLLWFCYYGFLLRSKPFTLSKLVFCLHFVCLLWSCHYGFRLSSKPITLITLRGVTVQDTGPYTCEVSNICK